MLEHLRPLIAKAVVRKFNNGATILYQGEVPRTAAIIVTGMVRVFAISDQGDEQIVLHHVAGEFFPSSWIFGKTPGTLFFYKAIGTCEIAFVPRKELIDFMLAEPPRMHALLDYFTTNFAASLIHINALEQPRARDKLVYILYYLCQRYQPGEARSAHIPIRLTHQNLASLVGLTRETTATEMSLLKKEHIISYHNQRYTVDLAKLLDLIGEDSFRGIHIGI